MLSSSEFLKIKGRRVFKNLTGKTFGNLKVLNFGSTVKTSWGANGYTWRCLCSCGKEILSRSDLLLRGKTKSCGCLSSPQVIRERSTVHGMRNTKFYAIWHGMKMRCRKGAGTLYNKNGIRVSAQWKKFTNFYSDMYESYILHVQKYGARQTTLDRVDNKRGYEKDNCRWATRKEQQRNKNNNVLFTIGGRTQTQAAWVEEAGVAINTFCTRLKKGWTAEEALYNKKYTHYYGH